MKKLFCLFVLLTLVGAQTINLPKPATVVGVDLMSALQQRHSVDSFVSGDVTDKQLATILWAANGINRPDGKRTAPSPYDTKCINLYVVRADGTYLYNAKDNTLERKLNIEQKSNKKQKNKTESTTEPILSTDLRGELALQPFVSTASVVILMTADLSTFPSWTAMFSKQSKLQSAAANTGFIGQNIYLTCATCASMKLGTRYVQWLKKEKDIRKKFGLKKDEYPLCVMPIGKTR